MCKKKIRDYRTEFEKSAEERYFTMRDGVQVRVLVFDFAEKPHKYKIFMIPGFATVFQGWSEMIERLSKNHTIYYFESREKASSIMPSGKIARNTSLHQMAYDIKEVVEQMKLDEGNYITISSSTGGTIQVEALSEKWMNPDGAVLIGPTIEYHIHWFPALIVTIFPAFLKALFTPLFRFYIGTFYVDKKKHPEQYAKYVRAYEEIQVIKIKALLWQITKYKCWEMPPKIDNTKCILVGAEEDKMHAAEETMRTHKLIPNSEYVDLGTNKATHTKPLVDLALKFIADLEK
jgi:alpha-beta hydrolase superfamily lysophospholipase